jgi:hypothetical protein
MAARRRLQAIEAAAAAERTMLVAQLAEAEDARAQICAAADTDRARWQSEASAQADECMRLREAGKALQSSLTARDEKLATLDLELSRAAAEAAQARTLADEFEALRGRLEVVEAARATAHDEAQRHAEAVQRLQDELTNSCNELARCAEARDAARDAASAAEVRAQQAQASAETAAAAQRTLEIERAGLSDRVQQVDRRLLAMLGATALEGSDGDPWRALDRLVDGAAANESAFASARQERDSLRAQIAEQLRTSALQSRLLLIREADLKDLQLRYGELQDKHQQQHELLSKVAQRLGVATQYYKQLALKQDADRSDDADSEGDAG